MQKGSDGKVRDPLTNKEMNYNDPWDMGHKPGYEHWKHQQRCGARIFSREQFLNEYNDPSKYRPELPSSNRSHAGEIKPMIILTRNMPEISNDNKFIARKLASAFGGRPSVREYLHDNLL